MTPNSERMPVLFVGHGSPMNIIEDNEWSRGFNALRGLLPKPAAILCVSAHWYVPGTLLTADDNPATIHDFYGFPEELYSLDYKAPGSPGLARGAAKLLGQSAVLSNEWGLDHGCWSVLRHLYPEADIPVVQLSVNSRLPAREHIALGAKLAPLRDDGVLIFGSGNIVHNLPYVFNRYFRGEEDTPDWAETFDLKAAQALQSGDMQALSSLLSTPEGHLSHPTPDHYFPLLYAAGAMLPGDAATFPITGFSLGSLSMRAVIYGA